MLLTSLLVTVATAQHSTDPTSQGVAAGRYAHCSVVWNDMMLTYGGKGFRQIGNTNSLHTLGCARA